jgi:hypothetical protein
MAKRIVNKVTGATKYTLTFTGEELVNLYHDIQEARAMHSTSGDMRWYTEQKVIDDVEKLLGRKP